MSVFNKSASVDAAMSQSHEILNYLRKVKAEQAAEAAKQAEELVRARKDYVARVAAAATAMRRAGAIVKLEDFVV